MMSRSFRDFLRKRSSGTLDVSSLSSVKTLLSLLSGSRDNSGGDSLAFSSRWCSSNSESKNPKASPQSSQSTEASPKSGTTSQNTKSNQRSGSGSDQSEREAERESPSKSSQYNANEIKEQFLRYTQRMRPSDDSKNVFGYPDRGLWFLGWDWLMEPFRVAEGIFNWFYGRIIRNYMDVNFDIEEFLEGAKDAFYMVNHLFEQGDYDSLKPMVSTKLYENMKATTEHFEKGGMQFSISPENIVGAYVAGLKIVQAQTLIPFGPEFDVANVSEGKENFWFLVYVRFARNEHYLLTRTTGEVVQDTTTRRRDLWTFVRGPISVLPLTEDSPGWTVLSIA